MMEDFNIRDSFWNLNFLYHSSHRDTLFDIADSFHLELSKPAEFFPTRYSYNTQDLNSVLDLMFLYLNSSEHDNHHIHPDWRLTSDYAPITIDISILKKHVQTKKQSLIKNSEEETHFIDELINSIKGLNIESIQSIDTLEAIIQLITNNSDRIWHKHSKIVNIIKHSKAWWDNNCHRDLDMYRQSKWLEDWKKFKGTVKKTKWNFFNGKINEIANENCSSWELMN